MSDDYDKQRQQNIKELNDFLADVIKNPEYEEALRIFKKPEIVRKPAVKRRRTDDTFKFTGQIPAESRKSPRLKKIEPQYNFDYLPDYQEDRQRRCFGSALEDLEDIVYRRKKTVDH